MRPIKNLRVTRPAPTLRASIAPDVELTWVDDVFTTIDGKKNTAASTCDADLLIAADAIEWERICRLNGAGLGQLVKFHGQLGGTVTAWRRADRLTPRGRRWSWTAIVRDRYGSTTLASPEPGEALSDWLSAVVGHDVLLRASSARIPF